MSPATSLPRIVGSSGGCGYRPFLIRTSAKLIPAALTETTDCPSPASGSGTSSTASGLPVSWRTAALTGRPSLAGELRLALLEERHHALGAVRAADAANEGLRLAPHPVRERQVARLRRELLDHSHRVRRALRERACDLHRRVHQLVARHDP